MSPVVLTLPVMVRSADRVDAGGLALGAVGDGAAEEDGVGAGFSLVAGEVAEVGGVAESVGLVLENIVCCLDIVHCVDGFAANAYFVMKVDTCAAA